MIGKYELDELLSKYGVDASKVVGKNSNVLTYGEYQEIKNVLEFLVCECRISPRNIEKCPSILSYNTQNIRENYEFLKNSNVNLSNVGTTLHVLCANPSDLKETYNYVLENYGMGYINRTTSILAINVDRIKKIEKMLNDKSLVISAAVSRLSIADILKDITFCKKNNIPITGSVFQKKSDEIERIVKVCKENKISISDSFFRQTTDEIERIIKVCKENNILISDSVFRQTADEIERIIKVCKENNIPITASVFQKKSDEIERIVKVCQKNNIPIMGNVFRRTADEIEQIIIICNENNVPITGSVFKKTADEIERIVKVCQENNIPIIDSAFLKTAAEIEKIIKVCQENNIPITGSVFYKTAAEIEKIIKICQENNIPITGSVFKKTADEIEEIVKVCRENNIIISGSLFNKNAEDLQASIDYVKSAYGQEYLVPLVVNKNVKHLQEVFPYLDFLGLLPYVIKSASILLLTLDEIMERKEYIESHGESLVTKTGRFNSIFGLSKKNYEKLCGMRVRL